ncbi:GNAT family N-acetyltransferase [Roseivirga sp. E12]|uniref:GNAT family N-acetyltransferase n=1 Tax=Roseivirga sp. E12 TaxID=2819237 RepID=UPI001ABC7946|nr:GNAT family N-acetyltransferase [Roseivirga sp. E12]MBO3700728.1 GNAT family N-acetyltransferase [Roseivirga sp. E12]
MIEIVDFKLKYANDFKKIGEEWINEYMHLKEPDISILNDPEGSIIKKGGYIYMAIEDNRAIGTCALIKKSDNRWELCKLGILKSHRGHGLGRKLSLRIIEQAKNLGLENLYLESSSKLKPAISLYQKLGFVEDQSCNEGTSQCDIKMVLHLNT